MCYFCKYITLCCRCCLSVVRTWRKRWRNSRTASHHWSTDSGMCVPTASPPPYWWSRLPTRSVRLSNLGLTGQTVIGRFACYWLNSLSLGRSCFICWWFGEKESMLYMNLFVSGLDQGEDQATAGELLPAGLGWHRCVHSRLNHEWCSSNQWCVPHYFYL